MTAPTIAPPKTERFSIGKTLRLSTFQIGSAMGDILTASVWNRVMISDLGMPATPVGLLLALQYLLIPITLWAGHRSDTKALRFFSESSRRTSYIWTGRFLVAFSFPFLGFSINQFEAGSLTVGWLLAILAFAIFGCGKLMSGSAYLALVRDSAPADKSGIAIGIAETILIACFPIAAIGFGRWMEQYEAAVFWQLILFTAIVGLFFWIFATFGAEKNIRRNSAPSSPKAPLRETFLTIWGDNRTRAFFVFLATATFFAWMQDNVLEPFGGDVFDYGAGVTTRFTGYWGGATILVVVICFGLFRRQPPENQNGISSWGLAGMGVGMLLIALVSMTNRPNLLSLALVVFGLGFGFYTFGGLSLMAAMSPTKNAGAYLGLWTACILLSKGSGTFFGGLLRDIFVRWIGLAPSLGYGLIFVVAALGLFVAAMQVRRIDVAGFVRENS